MDHRLEISIGCWGAKDLGPRRRTLNYRAWIKTCLNYSLNSHFFLPIHHTALLTCPHTSLKSTIIMSAQFQYFIYSAGINAQTPRGDWVQREVHVVQCLQVEAQFCYPLLFTKHCILSYYWHLCQRRPCAILFGECQKEDWCRHKKHCGKSRVSKKLQGTVHDPHWATSELPDHTRQIRYAEDGSIDFSSLGFEVPEHASTYSPALQRQVSLLTADSMTDYFLFDFKDCPIRFALFDPWMKMTFCAVRGDVLSGEDGLEAMAECLIKAMGLRPGLGWDRILAQLEQEYGGGVTTKCVITSSFNLYDHLVFTTFWTSPSAQLCSDIAPSFQPF